MSPGVRVQGVAPDLNYSLPGHRLLIHLVRPSGAFSRFKREEYLVPEELFADALRALLASDRPPGPLEEHRRDGAGARDILVCTHGARDGCCGAFGAALYTRLRRERGESSQGALRIWRSSHLGGHRFAPTLLDLPRMRYWGRATPELVDMLIEGKAPAERLRAHYRGWAGLRTPFEQVAEGEILTRYGWELADLLCSASSQVYGDEGERAKVRIAYRHGDGRPGPAFEAEVVRDRRIGAIASCGDDEVSYFDQYSVVDLIQVSEATTA